MTSNIELPVVSAGSSRNVATVAFTGPAPLNPGESSSAYDDLILSITTTLRPEDPLEEVWVREIVDVVWDAFRLRRIKVALLRHGERDGAQSVLWPLVESSDAQALVEGWARRDAEAMATIEATLAAAGLTTDVIMARTMMLKFSDIERVDRLILRAEARRSAMLRELDKHRSDLALRVRRAIKEADQADWALISSEEAHRRLA